MQETFCRSSLPDISPLKKVEQSSCRAPWRKNFSSVFDSSSFSQSDLSKKQSVWAIVAITLPAAVLRFWHIDSALWLDEVTPIFAYRNSTVVDLLTTYLSTNNH